jgi:hypothetical protein
MLLSRVRDLADPRWRRFYLQRLFLDPRLRNKIADRIASRRNEPAETSDSRDMVNELRVRGQTILGSLLDTYQCEQVRSFFSRCKVKDLYRPAHPAFLPSGEGRHVMTHTAFHDDTDVLKAPYILELANHPKILSVLHQYFGCKPLISYLACWWSYPTEAGPQQAESFHRDVDDWRFIKLFVYLTDVTSTSGPHVYVKDSASSRQLSQIRRYQDEEIIRTFGGQSVTTMTGAAGTGFLENTFGFHKGQQVNEGKRLMFQAVYSLSAIPYGPRHPILPFADRLEDGEYSRQANSIYLY